MIERGQVPVAEAWPLSSTKERTMINEWTPEQRAALEARMRAQRAALEGELEALSRSMQELGKQFEALGREVAALFAGAFGRATESLKEHTDRG